MNNGTGERVRALRTSRGIGQTELAAAVGVSKSYLSHIEAGRRPVSASLMTQLAQALEVEVEQLESGTPADANEDLQLRLSFAEMSLRNGEWDLALKEYSAIQERARELPLQRYLDEATWGHGACPGGHRRAGAGDRRLRAAAGAPPAERRGLARAGRGPPDDGLRRVRRSQPVDRRRRGGRRRDGGQRPGAGRRPPGRADLDPGRLVPRARRPRPRPAADRPCPGQGRRGRLAARACGRGVERRRHLPGPPRRRRRASARRPGRGPVRRDRRCPPDRRAALVSRPTWHSGLPSPTSTRRWSRWSGPSTSCARSARSWTWATPAPSRRGRC